MRNNAEADRAPIAHLNRLAIRVYRYAVAHGGCSRDDVAASCAAPAASIAAAIEALVDLRLLEPIGPERLAAIAPETAAAQLLGPAERELRRQQVEMDGLRDLLMSLVPIYEEGSTRGWRPGSVEALTNHDTVHRLVTELTANCRDEVLTAQPGGASPAAGLPDMAEHNCDLLERGVAVRALYQHTARFHKPTAEHAAAVARLGGRVRTVVGGLMQMIVFDRVQAMIPLRDRMTGAVLIRDPSTVDIVVAAFESIWMNAEPVPANTDKDQVHDLSERTKRAIVALLVEGHNDQAVGRSLGISVRTCQRHIAEIMTRLGAKNRLQLGFLLPRLGPVEGWTPTSEA